MASFNFQTEEVVTGYIYNHIEYNKLVRDEIFYLFSIQSYRLACQHLLQDTFIIIIIIHHHLHLHSSDDDEEFNALYSSFFRLVGPGLPGRGTEWGRRRKWSANIKVLRILIKIRQGQNI